MRDEGIIGGGEGEEKHVVLGTSSEAPLPTARGCTTESQRESTLLLVGEGKERERRKRGKNVDNKKKM